MLREFLADISSQAVKAAGVHVLGFGPSELSKHAVLNGELCTLDMAPPPMQLQAARMDDFILLCNQFAIDGVRPLVCVDDHGATAYFDPSKRTSFVRWERIYDPLFEFVQSITEGRNCSQEGLIELLRTTLRNCENAVSCLQQVRNIRWTKSSEMASSQNRGDESLGTMIQAKMAGVDDVPSELTAATAVFLDQDSPDDCCMFSVVIDPLPAKQVIRLQSMEDHVLLAIKKAKEVAFRELSDELKDATVVIGSAD